VAADEAGASSDENGLFHLLFAFMLLFAVLDSDCKVRHYFPNEQEKRQVFFGYLPFCVFVLLRV
jgi:hypothetical protein